MRNINIAILLYQDFKPSNSVISQFFDSDNAMSGFSFNEVDCIRTSNSKVVCCHFSSDGKILASAGHEKKV